MLFVPNVPTAVLPSRCQVRPDLGYKEGWDYFASDLCSLIDPLELDFAPSSDAPCEFVTELEGQAAGNHFSNDCGILVQEESANLKNALFTTRLAACLEVDKVSERRWFRYQTLDDELDDGEVVLASSWLEIAIRLDSAIVHAIVIATNTVFVYVSRHHCFHKFQPLCSCLEIASLGNEVATMEFPDHFLPEDRIT
jgi:hypothetical protein